MTIRYVVLDFDGTCTQVDRIQEAFLADYRKAIHADEKAWAGALETVRKASPTAGWTLMRTPSTAPAAADPYILASEAAALLARQHKIAQPTSDVFERCYTANVAPFRRELADVLAALAKKRINIGFISNTGRTKIMTRVGDLLGSNPSLRDRIHYGGGAEKYMLGELAIESTNPHRARFEALPAAVTASTVNRPLYLRRGAYFDALCNFYQSFGDATFPIEKTLVCGDIWELDLAMPAVLGAQVHLVERAEPFPTYPYELAAMDKKHISKDLKGLLKRI
jgi:phosphoglycolate phosphatase-like HAD superfamily hydrolase